MQLITVKVTGGRVILSLSDEYGTEVRILSPDTANKVGRALIYASQPDRDGYETTIKEAGFNTGRIDS